MTAGLCATLSFAPVAVALADEGADLLPQEPAALAVPDETSGNPVGEPAVSAGSPSGTDAADAADVAGPADGAGDAGELVEAGAADAVAAGDDVAGDGGVADDGVGDAAVETPQGSPDPEGMAEGERAVDVEDDAAGDPTQTTASQAMGGAPLGTPDGASTDAGDVGAVGSTEGEGYVYAIATQDGSLYEDGVVVGDVSMSYVGPGAYVVYTEAPASGVLAVPVEIDGAPVVGVYLHGVAAAEFDASACSTLAYLRCELSGIMSLDLAGTALEYLRVDACDSLVSIDVSDCPSLGALGDFDNQSLSALDASNCPQLNRIACSDCSTLSSLDVSNCSGLPSLTVSMLSSLTALNVSGCTSMTQLACTSCALTALVVTGCPSLASLDCSNNPLTSLSLSCPSLTSLVCQYTDLTSLDLTGCGALATVDCNALSQSAQLDVSGLSS